MSLIMEMVNEVKEGYEFGTWNETNRIWMDFMDTGTRYIPSHSLPVVQTSSQGRRIQVFKFGTLRAGRRP